MRLIFKNGRCRGWVSKNVVEKESRTEIPTTEEELRTIFEEAKAAGESLDGADESIDASIDDPLGFLDYLILDPGGDITFDSEHNREDK